METTVFNRPYWRVYIEDFGQKCIEKYNIFEHNEFWDMCNIIWINVHDHSSELEVQKAEFEYDIQRELLYYFSEKHEWEINLTTTIEYTTEFKNMKTDVYSQVMMNYGVFINYLWTWFEKHKEN